MLSCKSRLIAVTLTVALVACGANAGAPSPTAANSANAGSVASPDGLHDWRLDIRNDAHATVKQFAPETECMAHVFDGKVYQHRNEVYVENLETSHDLWCYVKTSKVTLQFFSETGGRWGAVRWTKSALDDYEIHTIENHGLCFGGTSHGNGIRTLKLYNC
ncbi:MAG TPA: hypothetical protein VHR97_04200 [Candidatus Baltobacteraceae bacterium]|jgi:hypothetical protein|nr:hypothetical protein [Candidatus Baltobacteraceae bacterium]